MHSRVGSDYRLRLVLWPLFVSSWVLYDFRRHAPAFLDDSISGNQRGGRHDKSKTKRLLVFQLPSRKKPRHAFPVPGLPSDWESAELRHEVRCSGV